MPKPRNPYVFHPLMRKGGAHEKSKTADRMSNRQSLLDEADEYLSERNETQEMKNVTGPVNKARYQDLFLIIPQGFLLPVH